MSMVMPFGKYKGRPLDDVPDDYLIWLYDSNVQVNQEIAKVLKLGRPVNGNAGAEPGALKAQLLRLRRQLARKYHPDAGGNNEAMAAVNVAMDEVLKILKG